MQFFIHQLIFYAFSVFFYLSVASWKYDKRPINGAPFVYFCTELISREDEENTCSYNDNNNNNINNKNNNNNNNNNNNKNNNNNNNNKMQSIYSYTKNVLDALTVKWGPAHIGKY